MFSESSEKMDSLGEYEWVVANAIIQCSHGILSQSDKLLGSQVYINLIHVNLLRMNHPC